MRIAVTGASGLIGGALVPHLRAQGHEVLRMVRADVGGTRRGRLGPDGRHRRRWRVSSASTV